MKRILSLILIITLFFSIANITSAETTKRTQGKMMAEKIELIESGKVRPFTLQEEQAMDIMADKIWEVTDDINAVRSFYESQGLILIQSGKNKINKSEINKSEIGINSIAPSSLDVSIDIYRYTNAYKMKLWVLWYMDKRESKPADHDVFGIVWDDNIFTYISGTESHKAKNQFGEYFDDSEMENVIYLKGTTNEGFAWGVNDAYGIMEYPKSGYGRVTLSFDSSDVGKKTTVHAKYVHTYDKGTLSFTIGYPQVIKVTTGTTAKTLEKAADPLTFSVW